MLKQYGKKKGKKVFYASANKGGLIQGFPKLAKKLQEEKWLGTI